MNSTPELLGAVKRRHKLTSDYQLGQLLAIDRAQISAYMHGKRGLTERDALKVADALDIPGAAVLASVALERARTDEGRKAWRDAIKRLGGIAASAMMAVGAATLMLPPPAAAGSLNNNQIVRGAEYTLRNKRRSRWRDALGL